MCMFELLILILSGLGAGFVTGLIAMSATNIVMPLLVIFLGYNPYMAVGLSLGIDVFASSSAGVVFGRKGKVEWKPALLIAGASLFGIIVGSYWSFLVLPEYLTFLVGIGISIVGFDFVRKGALKLERPKGTKLLGDYKKLSIVLGSLAIGLISGLFGGGGGLMIVILLISIFHFNIHRAIGTSIVTMIFIAFLGSMFHYINMDFSLLDLALAGSFAAVSAYITARYTTKLNHFFLKKLSGLVIFSLGIIMLMKSLFSLLS